MPIKLTADILTAAIEGFQAQKKRIDALISDIKQQLSGGRGEPAATAEAPKRRRRMSAAARKRIGAAQRKRWAEARNQAGDCSGGRLQTQAETQCRWQKEDYRSHQEALGAGPSQSGGASGPSKKERPEEGRTRKNRG